MAEETRDETISRSFEEFILPEQRKKLATLEVAPISHFVKPELLQALNAAYTGPETFATNWSYKFANHLKEEGEPEDKNGREIREFKIDGDPEIYIARKMPINASDTYKLEIFKLPEINLRKQNILQYVHFIVGNSSDKATDLLRLGSEDTPVYHLVYPVIPADNTPAYRLRGRRIVLPEVYNTKQLSGTYWKELNVGSPTAIHELAHSIQLDSKRSKIKIPQPARVAVDNMARLFKILLTKSNQPLTPMAKLQIKLERNAWSFTLNVIRRCREKGLDLTPGMKNGDLLNMVNEALQTYDTFNLTKDETFNKSKMKS